jgi:PAS domain S-box-containing protein
VHATAVDGSATGFVVTTHVPSLVVLSVVISILGAYAAVELVERVRNARRGAWLLWLAGAATADGIGTWSMHYTAKLALRVPGGLYFDWRLVVLSFLVGVAGSAATLFLVGRHQLSWWRALAAGVVLGGVGISGLHYTAMASVIRPHIRHYHSPAQVVLSVAVAIALACASVALAFRWSAAGGNRLIRMGVTSLVRGMANPAMHYTAMAGVVFAFPSAPPHPAHGVSMASIGVIGISVVPVMVLIVALLTSFIDRLQKDRAVLDKLFAETPEAVAITREDGEVVRINRQFTQLFGYTADEAVGRRLDDLLARGAAARPGETVPKEGRLAIEGVRRRKDGTELHVGGVSVQVSMPNGATEHYALMRDVTAQKQAEEALRLFPRRLIATQETERRRIAHELHDEIGQMLTGAGMLLGSTQGMPADAEARIAEARAVLHNLTTCVRNMALDLRPALLDDFGLVRALDVLIQRYEQQTGFRIAFEHAGIDAKRLRPEIEIAAYRIVQEALTNVARHAEVGEAAVRISLDEESLYVKVEDRGTGFDVERLSADTVGLAGMRERATAAGGELTVTSSPQSGTRVAARLPLRVAAGGDERREVHEP